MVLNSQGSLYTEQGRYHEALPLLERSLELKRKIGHRRAEHITLHNLGTVANQLGKYSQARNSLEQVVQFTADTRDREGQSDALIELAITDIHLGQFSNARTILETVLSNEDEIENRSTRCNALTALGWVEHCLGNDQTAERRCREALGLATAASLARERVNATIFLGHALTGQGRLAPAAEAYREGLEILLEMNHPSRIAEVNTWIGSASLASGDTGEAGRRINAVLAYLESFSPAAAGGLRAIPYAPLEGMDEPFRALLACIRVLLALGDGRHGDLLSAAYRLLQEQAAVLDETTRQGFFENIPWHKEILAEWENQHG
jgi:tetratricopeptide (TPR) repeat protein